MCQSCDKEVIEMGIMESDLPNLPYKLVNWHCVVEGCKGKTKLRDYGIAPFYFWQVKVYRGVKKGIEMWRGGWMMPDHCYICSKHWRHLELDKEHFYKKHLYDYLKTTDWRKVLEYLNTKVSPIVKSKLYKVR